MKAPPIRKEVNISIKPQTNVWQVAFRSGGQLPTALTGCFTNKSLAQKAVDMWRTSINDKVSGRP